MKEAETYGRNGDSPVNDGENCILAAGLLVFPFAVRSMLSEAALALEVRINDDSGSVMDSVKLIASDMDGTLLNGKGELDPAFFPCLGNLSFAAFVLRQQAAASMTDCSGPLPRGGPDAVYCREWRLCGGG